MENSDQRQKLKPNIITLSVKAETEEQRGVVGHKEGVVIHSLRQALCGVTGFLMYGAMSHFLLAVLQHPPTKSPRSCQFSEPATSVSTSIL